MIAPMLELLVARPGLIPFLFIVAMYFLPSIIAAFRSHAHIGPIVVINFFLGWTFTGGVVALAWSVSSRGRRA